ncbi:DDE superfamily endonuclease [Popillia japonica]|uniref:DDE superfamily endonuclease n=1 Tax=Popillia japonica TaxID=7064 RepID=A0AAW1L7R5_POPJA
MGKSSLFSSFLRVINALNEIASTIIKWSMEDDRQNIKTAFRAIAGKPGIIVAIDGTYVPIKAPRENPESYINRKCFHGITLQAICQPNLMFTDCFTGYPSSVSDIRIFRNSDIYNSILSHFNTYFNEDEYVIGDKAYPTLNWCIPPFIERGRLTREQIRFNTIHAKTRQVIERAFALLFGRFRRLRYVDMNRVDLIPSTIIAACTLHNLCLMQPDALLAEYVQEVLAMGNNPDNIDNEDGLQDGDARRNYLLDIINN